MEVVTDAHNANIVVVYAQTAQERFIGAVTDLGIGHIRKDLLHQFFLVVNRHDLMIQLPELHSNVLSETAKAN